MPHQVNDDYLLEVTRAISQQCEQMHSCENLPNCSNSYSAYFSWCKSFCTWHKIQYEIEFSLDNTVIHV